MNMTMLPAQVAAERARIIAQVARDRFAPPATITVLRFIASHLDRAATAYDSYRQGTLLNPLFEAAHAALNDARELAQLHPDTRFPVNFTDYVEAAFSGVTLPMPTPLNPVSDALRAREATLTHRLTLIHAALNETGSVQGTDAWLSSALAVQRDLMRLADEVRVDNARPCNQR
jgi:hypothetical protein